LIHTIPLPVIGGLSFVVFGLIAATAGRIWVDAKVDFAQPKNLLVVGVALVMGAGDLTVTIGDFPFGGIAMTTFSALGLYHLLGLFQRRTAG
ncbi:MAG: solute carrier family 23 protein, partial [Hyphomicrobiaceae bacterium]